MRKLVKGEAESCALPGADGRLDFDSRTVKSTGCRSESPVNAVHGGLLLHGWQGVAGDLFGKHNRRRRLSLHARRKELFGKNLGTGAGESADHACKCAFEYGSFVGSHVVIGCRRAGDTVPIIIFPLANAA